MTDRERSGGWLSKPKVASVKGQPRSISEPVDLIMLSPEKFTEKKQHQFKPRASLSSKLSTSVIPDTDDEASSDDDDIICLEDIDRMEKEAMARVGGVNANSPEQLNVVQLDVTNRDDEEAEITYTQDDSSSVFSGDDLDNSPIDFMALDGAEEPLSSKKHMKTEPPDHDTKSSGDENDNDDEEEEEENELILLMTQSNDLLRKLDNMIDLTQDDDSQDEAKSKSRRALKSEPSSADDPSPIVVRTKPQMLISLDSPVSTVKKETTTATASGLPRTSRLSESDIIELVKNSDISIPLKRIDSLTLSDEPAAINLAPPRKRNRGIVISDDSDDDDILSQFMDDFEKTTTTTTTPARESRRRASRESKTTSKQTPSKKNRLLIYEKDDDEEEDEVGDNFDYDDIFETGLSPERSTTKPKSAIKTLNVPSKIDYDSLASYFASGSDKDVEMKETTTTTKDYKSLLSEKHSSKPPATTPDREKDKSKLKTSPVVLDSPSIMPLHSKVVVQPKKVEETKPVDEQQKLSSLIKSIASSDAMNKRTTLLLDPVDPKRPKLSPPLTSTSSVPEDKTENSPPLPAVQQVETETIQPAEHLITDDEDAQDEDEEEDESKKGAKDPRSVYDNIRNRLQQSNRVAKVRTAAAPTPAYLDKIKALKCRETAQFLQARKLPKKAPLGGDLNLTQSLNHAKLELERRLEAKQQMEASRATAPGGPLSKQSVFGGASRPPSSSAEVMRSKSVSRPAGLYEQPQKFKQPLSANALKQNDNSGGGGLLKSKASEAERLLRHHEILKKMQKAETQKHQSAPLQSVRTSSGGTTNEYSRSTSSSSSSAMRTTKETKENDLVGQIMNTMNKQAAQMRSASDSANKPNKTGSEQHHVQFEEFIYHIVSWSHNWLQEYTRLQEAEKCPEPPPVTKAYQAMPMIDNYVAFSDYYKAMFPLLLYEAWEELYREYREMTQKRERRTYQDMPFWYKSTESCPDFPRLNVIRLQTIVETSTKGFPSEDDLLRLSFEVRASKEGGKEGGPHQVLGIVHKIHKFKPDEGPVMPAVKEFLKTVSSSSSAAPKTGGGYSDSSFGAKTSFESSFSVYELSVYVKQLRQQITTNMKVDYDCFTNLASTFRRAKALCSLQTCGICSSLLRVMPSDPIFWLNPEVTKKSKDAAIFAGFEEFNESQKEVIIEASSIINYREPKLYFIQGPPGTGKSHTIIGIIKAIYSRLNAAPPQPASASTVHSSNGSSATSFAKPSASTSSTNNYKLLICSPSNGGCDEITRRIVRLLREKKMVQYNHKELSVVRVGRIDHMHKDCEDVGLESLARKKHEEMLNEKALGESSSHQKYYDDLKKNEIMLSKRLEMLKASSSSSKAMLAEIESQIQGIQEKKKKLETQLKRGREKNKSVVEKRKDLQKAKEAVLKEANIIICTLNFCGNQLLDCLKPDKVTGKPLVSALIIDEAAQCLEVECLIPLRFKCNRLILVGDPEQLPATVLSKRAQENGLAQSLFERVYQNFRFQEQTPIKMLYVQYRMHPDICAFPSLNFYRGKLQTSKETAVARSSAKFERKNYLIFDVPGSAEVGGSGDGEQTGAIHNPVEAECVLELCQYMHRRHANMSIGVITPYQRQATHLRDLLNKNYLDRVEVGTVDSYQGREKDIIIFSTVRANPSRTIGFLTHRQRLNVSLTRAKFALYIVCNMETLQNHEEWRKCFENARNRQLIQTYQK